MNVFNLKFVVAVLIVFFLALWGLIGSGETTSKSGVAAMPSSPRPGQEK